jgi:hypothetical protein
MATTTRSWESVESRYNAYAARSPRLAPLVRPMLSLSERLSKTAFVVGITPYVSHVTLRLQLPEIRHEVGVVVTEDGLSYKVMVLGPQLEVSRVRFVPNESVIETIAEYVGHLKKTYAPPP